MLNIIEILALIPYEDAFPALYLYFSTFNIFLKLNINKDLIPKGIKILNRELITLRVFNIIIKDLLRGLLIKSFYSSYIYNLNIYIKYLSLE